MNHNWENWLESENDLEVPIVTIQATEEMIDFEIDDDSYRILKVQEEFDPEPLYEISSLNK